MVVHNSAANSQNNRRKNGKDNRKLVFDQVPKFIIPNLTDAKVKCRKWKSNIDLQKLKRYFLENAMKIF